MKVKEAQEEKCEERLGKGIMYSSWNWQKSWSDCIFFASAPYSEEALYMMWNMDETCFCLAVKQL